MNYYERHIGDYLKDTAHLSLLEHGVYTRLLDVYYTREGAIPDDEVARLIAARSKEERAALTIVLREFFVLIDGAYCQKRCDEELQAYRDGQEGVEDKKENDKERQRRARERRKKLFEDLRCHGIVPPWDTKTAELQTLLSRVTNTPPSAPVTQPVTRDNTATQTPDTRHQTPDKEKAPSELADSPKFGDPPPLQPFDGKNAEILNGKAVVALSPQWELPESWGVDAESLGWTPSEVLLEAEKFRQYWTAGKGTGTRRAVKGWRQTWSNWLGKAAERKIR